MKQAITVLDARVIDKNKAQAMSKEASILVQRANADLWELADHVEKCLAMDVHGALGLTRKEWMVKYLNGSVSDTYAKLKLARKLKELAPKDRKQLSIRNAQALTRLTEKERKSDSWVKKAKELPDREFVPMVQAHLEKKSTAYKDPLRTYAIMLSKSVFGVLEDAELRIAKIMGLELLPDESLPTQDRYVDRGKREHVWEQMAKLINYASDDILRAKMDDGDGLPPITDEVN